MKLRLCAYGIALEKIIIDLTNELDIHGRIPEVYKNEIEKYVWKVREKIKMFCRTSATIK